MLSGGGREILASYTAFRYQGNFSDVACRLIDTLPYQSPAMVSPRLNKSTAELIAVSPVCLDSLNISIT